MHVKCFEQFLTRTKRSRFLSQHDESNKDNDNADSNDWSSKQLDNTIILKLKIRKEKLKLTTI